MAPYAYQPLDLPRETRILTIMPGHYDDPVLSTLCNMPLSPETEPYDALSYCWTRSVTTDEGPDYNVKWSWAVCGEGVKESGEVEFRHLLDHPYMHRLYIRNGGALPAGTILCDGVEMQVGGELYRAIKRMRSEVAPRRIWIGAICINQNDVKERNEHASCVRIWLGEEIGIEIEAMRVLEVAEQILVDAIEATKTLPGVTRSNVLSQVGKDTRTSELPWESLHAFFNRSWFQRIWVVQEAVNARKATVQIGSHFLFDWHWLTTVVSVSRFYKMDRALETDSVKAICTMDWMNKSREGERQSPGISLLDGLEETRAFQSTLASDKVYAAVGLVNSIEDIVVDYDLDAAEVFKRLAVAFLTKRRSLDMLYHCMQPKVPSSVKLPSWVADWTAPGWVEPFRSRRLAANAGGGTETRLMIDNDEQALIIWGKAIGKVAAVDNVKAIPAADPSDSIGSWYAADVVTGKDEIAAVTKKAVDSKYRNRLRVELNHTNVKDSLQNILDIAASGPIPASQSREALARTFMCNRTLEDKVSDSSCCLGLDALISHTMFNESIESCLRRIVDHLNQHGAPNGENVEESYDTVKRSFETFLASYTRWTYNRRFFRTDLGNYGWGIHGIQPGDVVSVFWGGDYPFILREIEDGRFKIIGDCFLQGFMDGESLSCDSPDRSFCIV
ncbi:heterokaryon incompatibility protein domain-containing protein [Trichoderma barbatum]